MLHIGMLVLGAYFCLMSLWWLTHTTARYYHSRRRHIDFTSSVTFPCCCSSKCPALDGIFKIAIAAVLSFAEFSFDRGYDGERVFLSRMELGTIFIFLLFSGVMDVLARWGSKTFHQYLDFAGLVLFFVATAAILESHAYISAQPVSTLHCLAAYAALGSAVVTVVEAVYSDQVLCPMMRSYGLLLQGTWWIHVTILMQEELITSTHSAQDTSDIVCFFALVFSAHAAINFAIVTCLWLLVGKLVEKSWCGCVGGEGKGQTDDVFLENRVRFNYHVLSRLDSETE